MWKAVTNSEDDYLWKFSLFVTSNNLSVNDRVICVFRLLFSDLLTLYLP